MVADESTKLKGFRLRQGSVRTRALGKVAHTRVKRFIELTGTPAPNGLKTLGSNMVHRSWSKIRHEFQRFTDRWFQK